MNETFAELWARYSGIIFALGKNILVAFIIAAMGKFISQGAEKLIGANSRSPSSSLKIDDTISQLLRRLVRYGIFIICLIMILNVFGVDTTGLLALLGAAGLAVGLALKDTLSNIAAGMILIFLGIYRRGDYIEFGSYSGTVKEVRLFTTILETPDGIYISAPNSNIWETPLKNYTRNGKRRMDISVPVAYSDSIDTAFQVVKDMAAAESRFLAEPAPQILVQSYGDSSVNILLRAWAPLNLYWTIYWDQMRGLKEKLEEAGLHIPFPQRDIHLYAEQRPSDENKSHTA